jgi:hypothetical protein
MQKPQYVAKSKRSKLGRKAFEYAGRVFGWIRSQGLKVEEALFRTYEHQRKKLVPIRFKKRSAPNRGT